MPQRISDLTANEIRHMSEAELARLLRTGTISTAEDSWNSSGSGQPADDYLTGQAERNITPLTREDRTEILATGSLLDLTTDQILQLSDTEIRLLNHIGKLAPNTKASYRSHWNGWEKWCMDTENSVMPAHPGTIIQYLEGKMANQVLGTVAAAAAAINHFHKMGGYPRPLDRENQKGFLETLAVRHIRRPKQVEGLTAANLEKIQKTAYIPRNKETETQALRRGIADLAMIGLMRDALLRRSEAAALRWHHLKESQDGRALITIETSKTDRKGHGAVKPLTGQTVRWLRNSRGRARDTDPIIGIGGRQIARRIRDAAVAAGLEGRYRGHSPRIGQAQDMAAAGYELPAIMQAGRWKSVSAVMRYIEHLEARRSVIAQMEREMEREIEGCTVKN